MCKVRDFFKLYLLGHWGGIQSIEISPNVDSFSFQDLWKHWIWLRLNTLRLLKASLVTTSRVYFQPFVDLTNKFLMTYWSIIDSYRWITWGKSIRKLTWSLKNVSNSVPDRSNARDRSMTPRCRPPDACGWEGDCCIPSFERASHRSRTTFASTYLQWLFFLSSKFMHCKLKMGSTSNE